MSTDKKLSDDDITEIYLAWSARTKTELITFHAFARELIEADRKLAQGKPAANLVPGRMRCAKCEFVLTRVNLYVNSGQVGAGSNETEPCPNGCGPLWPVTWQQEAEAGYKANETLFERTKAAEDRVAELERPTAAVLQSAAPQLAQPENHDSVRTPIGEDEAAMMVMLGTNWLKAHAPERLAQPRGEHGALIQMAQEYARRIERGTYLLPNRVDEELSATLFALCEALAAPQAAVPAENSEHQSAALVGEPFLPKDSPGHSV